MHPSETKLVSRAVANLDGMAPNIATNTEVGLDELLEFVRPRHRMLLITERADGSPHVVPVGVTFDPATATARVITSGSSAKARHVRAGQARVAVCQVDGADVRTVEGLAGRPAVAGGPARLDQLQAAFLETGGAQCGICTPGMLMAARAYLDAGGGPDEDAIRDAIAGNLCRCTGYTKIIEAIALAAEGARP